MTAGGIASKERPERRTQSERRAATRAQLLDAARRLFVERGYAETGTPEIVREAGLTRGALYHHFADKADLFRGVCAREAEAIGQAIEEATREIHDPSDAMRVGTSVYFGAMSVPGRAKLLLLDAPAVLGHDEAVALTRGEGSAELRDGLSGMLPDATDAELDALTDVLSAAFDRAALAIANGADARSYTDALQRTIAGLESSDRR